MWLTIVVAVAMIAGALAVGMVAGGPWFGLPPR
jgi:hypothetical protein